MTYLVPVKASPNGKCWDDCGGTPKPGSFWLLGGHEKRAARYLDVVQGTIIDRLAALGYDGSGQLRLDTLAKAASYEECGRLNLAGLPCLIIGQNPGIARHRADDKQHSD